MWFRPQSASAYTDFDWLVLGDRLAVPGQDLEILAVERRGSELKAKNCSHVLAHHAPTVHWPLAMAEHVIERYISVMTEQAIPRLDGTSATAAQAIAALRTAGAVIIENLVDSATMDTIAAELAPFLDATPPGNDAFIGYSTRRTGSLIARSPSFRPLAHHPLVTGALDEILGDHASSYQLHLTQIIAIGACEVAQPVHRDQWAFDFFEFPSGFEVECHCMWAMTDFTEANGGTRVIPGSHQWADKLRPTFDETVAVEMSKGSLLLYVGSLYHGGGPNRTDEVRMGINVGYTLSWLRQEENQYLACPPDIARELPRELAKLIGYARGAYALGYFGDVQDPMDALHGPSSVPPSFTAS